MEGEPLPYTKSKRGNLCEYENHRLKQGRTVIVTVLVIIIVVAVLALLFFLLWFFFWRKVAKCPVGTAAQDAACTSDRDCASGLFCDPAVHKCKVPSQGACTASSQCSTNAICHNNKCAGNFFSPCDTESDCALPFSCFKQGSQPTNLCGSDACVTSADCRDATKEFCSGGTCILRAQEPCQIDSQCSLFSGTAVCSGGICKSNIGTACAVNGDCVSGNCTLGLCV